MPRTTDDAFVSPTYLHQAVAKGVSEAELLEWVCDLATLHGWEWRHAHDSRRQALEGLPDLVLWKNRMIWVELKAEKGKLSRNRLTKQGVARPGQVETIESMERAGIEVYVWRPSDWQSGEIERVLGV